MSSSPSAAPGVDQELVGSSGISGQGPFYEVTLRVSGGTVVSASYRTFCCVWSETIGSMAVAIVTGQSLEWCRSVHERELLARLLEPVPRSKEELPGMVCAAIRQAAELSGYSRESAVSA